MHHTVVVNAKAGTVLAAGPEAFAQRLRSAFAAQDCSVAVKLVHPRELSDALALAIRDESCIPVVAGGDGTINGVLPVLLEAGRPVGVLPLGTVNVLGRDLGLYGTLEHQIAALCKGEPVALDIGQVNDRLFHSISGMGFFSLMAREREYARRRFPSAATSPLPSRRYARSCSRARSRSRSTPPTATVMSRPTRCW